MKNDRYIPALGYDALTPYYDKVVGWTTREKIFKNALVEQAQVGMNQRVLDLACGTGTLTILLKKAAPAAEIWGVDGDPKILKLAREKARLGDFEIRFDEGMSFDLPYADASFDRVVSSLFFHHLTPESKRKTLLEVRRILKTGGTLHVADWGKPANLLMKFASTPVQWLDGATTKDSYAGRLPELMAEAGFADIIETADYSTVFGTLRLDRAVKK